MSATTHRIGLLALAALCAAAYACGDETDDSITSANATSSASSSSTSSSSSTASSSAMSSSASSATGGAGGQGQGGAGGAGQGGGGGAPMCTDEVTTEYVMGSGFDGAMFDITAINTVTITSFDANLVTSPSNTHNMEIYAISGTHVGNETNMNAWTLVGSSLQVASTGEGMATPIPIPINITIQAGQSYGFYVTTTDTDGFGVNYSGGTLVGQVFAADANIQVKEGVGNAYPFTVVSNGAPRVWNGTVHYCP